MSKTFIPLEDRVLVELLEPEARSRGGIVIPDVAKEKPRAGVVRAIGPGKERDNGTLKPMVVKIGDEVVFGRYAGVDVQHDGKEYKLMPENEIFAKVG